MMQVIHIGTPGDQALHALATKLRTDDILIAEPWDDGNSGGTAWWRLWRGRTTDIGQCGYVEDRRRYDAPRLAVDSRVRWMGSGLRIRPKKFPTRDQAMAYVDGELRKAGWVLP